MPLHVDYILEITQLPREAIGDCSAQGRVDEAVAYWRSKLGFTVDRDKAITCLQGYGAWEADELAALSDEAVADKILWLAAGDFSEYITECEHKGVDPFGERPDGFDPSSGSDIFVLE